MAAKKWWAKLWPGETTPDVNARTCQDQEEAAALGRRVSSDPLPSSQAPFIQNPTSISQYFATCGNESKQKNQTLDEIANPKEGAALVERPPSQDVKCGQCGIAFTPNSNFCSNCGKLLKPDVSNTLEPSDMSISLQQDASTTLAPLVGPNIKDGAPGLSFEDTPSTRVASGDTPVMSPEFGLSPYPSPEFDMMLQHPTYTPPFSVPTHWPAGPWPAVWPMGHPCPPPPSFLPMPPPMAYNQQPMYVQPSLSNPLRPVNSPPALSPRTEMQKKLRARGTIRPDNEEQVQPNDGIQRDAPKTTFVEDGELKEIDEENLNEAELTTIMITNLKSDSTRDKVAALLNDLSFKCRYDLIYQPLDLKEAAKGNFVAQIDHKAGGRQIGKAFVNFLTNEDAVKARECFNAPMDQLRDVVKDAVVDLGEEAAQNGKRHSGPWSEWAFVQGREANVERYRDSNVMHSRVPDVCKPAIYSNGSLVEFPPPYFPDKLKFPKEFKSVPSSRNVGDITQDTSQLARQGRPRGGRAPRERCQERYPLGSRLVV